MFKFWFRVMFLIFITGFCLAGVIVVLKVTANSHFWSRHHRIALAYLGTFLSVGSLVYSLRKHTRITHGSLGFWLRIHIILGTGGILFALAHTQFDFGPFIPILLTANLTLVGLTGLYGWYSYRVKVQTLILEIRSLQQAEEIVLAKMASSAFRFWRLTHVLAAIGTLFLTIIHVMSLIVFRGQF